MEEIVKYDGELTQNIIANFMDNIEDNISNMVTMANISTIVIEMCQNMMNYSKDKDINSSSIEPAGSITVIIKNDDSYIIEGKNIVSLADKEKIEPKVLEIQSLDKAGIKKRYKELRRSGKNTHSKGGGVGTYEIAKICDRVEYIFEAINDDRYFFTLKTIINPKVKKSKSLNGIKKSILIIDNCETTGLELKDIFEKRNFNVILTQSTEKALDILNEKEINLLLLDNDINDSNGIKFIIDNHNKIINLLKIPVFIISKELTPTLLKSALTNGVKDVLKKPYIIDELLIKADIWIENRAKELKEKEVIKILKEYKDAVDESAIVTKANTKGIITYVNEQFCTLSGYTKEELIGKNHNIVRHEDVDSSIYKDMWHTIKKLKKPWRGEIKNKKKDGSYYWVQSFIKPILDIDKNIVEYIGIRVDITESKDRKE